MAMLCTAAAPNPDNTAYHYISMLPDQITGEANHQIGLCTTSGPDLSFSLIPDTHNNHI